MTKFLLAAPLLACAVFAGSFARAGADAEDDAPANVASLFQQGRLELAIGGGYGVDNGRSYGIVELGGGYFFRDGLSAGVTSEAWLGSLPQIYDVSPQARYVFLDSTWGYKPYAGIFYRRTAYSRTLSPIDSVGGRGGLVLPLGPNAYLTGGLAYEHYFACSTAVYSSCDPIYPEIGLEFSF